MQLNVQAALRRGLNNLRRLVPGDGAARVPALDRRGVGVAQRAGQGTNATKLTDDRLYAHYVLVGQHPASEQR